MARKLVFLLLLWGFTLFVHGGTSFCDVTCSTDYDVTVNCSCSASLPTHSVLIQVNCSDGFEVEAHGSCKVNPPQSWCVMYPEDLEEITSIGTMCTATVTQQGGPVIMNGTESSSWELSHVVKSLPPFNVQVTNSDGFYNITWDHNNKIDCLTYRVRVRESRDLSKDTLLSDSVQEKQILIEHKTLQPHVNYTVDVGAIMCPENLYWGPWSEWSPSAEWRTVGSSAEMNMCWWYTLLSIILIFVVLSLVYSQKTFFKAKLQLITYVPAPDDFFKPLYQNYGGNFQEWVKPVFKECDYLRISSHVQMHSEKQPDVLQLKNEKQSYSEDNEVEQGQGHFLHMQQPHSNSLLFFQDSGSSEGTGHSTGHISIHTVTLSGEEEFEEDVVSRRSVNTLRSYHGGESFGSFEDDNGGHAGYDLEDPRTSRLERQIGMLPQHENQISIDLSMGNLNFQPHVQLNEPERVSLDSFASHEQSEDGYPHVDLDTIDSGFGECSSPGASDSHMAEQIDLFHEHKNSNSNYVKQWMICSTIQEDSSNSENELQETQ
uniref:interleukin 21 receptor, tandem duplicate 1 n=1 Tax=Semicossyphus pulcher TaxID=241346 RepID=UPI0037E84271